MSKIRVAFHLNGKDAEDFEEYRAKNHIWNKSDFARQVVLEKIRQEKEIKNEAR